MSCFVVMPPASFRWPTAATPTKFSGSSRGPAQSFRYASSASRDRSPSAFGATTSKSLATPPLPTSCAPAPTGRRRGSTTISSARRYGLHAAGQAHSIECWQGEGEARELVGGLYGVRLGRAFFGEFDVQPPHRCLEGRAGVAGGAAACRPLPVARLPVHDRSPCLTGRGVGAARSLRRVALDRAGFGRGVGRLDGGRIVRAVRRTSRGGRSPPPEFGALDRLLAAPEADGAISAAPGQLIAQLLTQTS